MLALGSWLCLPAFTTTTLPDRLCLKWNAVAGENSYIRINESVRGDIGHSWTIALWVYPERFSIQDVIFSYQVRCLAINFSKWYGGSHGKHKLINIFNLLIG